jgi:arylsulfatase
METQLRGARPNIVLFIGDDISVGDFGCYGHPTSQTPRVDRLASEGVRFANAYLTTSSCSPTRTSLITGRWPHNTGAPELHMTESPHLGELPQFPHELREAGYFTAQAGKWHFNGDATKSFDRRHESPPSHPDEPSGAEMWLPILRERPKDRPFFLWYAAHDAHRGWDQPLSAGPHGPDDVEVPPYLVDGARTREDLAHYVDEVHRFDANIGAVLDELERQGVRDDTVVLVMTDNGRPFPRDKTWLYDSGIKTPLVVHWPARLARPAVVSSLISVIDLAPTILELAGVEPPPSFQGVSLVPLLADPGASVRDLVFAERNWHTQRYHERMVRYENLVYIRNNLPQLIGFNLAHYGKMNQPAYLELVDEWRAGETTPPQEDVFAKPRPSEMLFDVSADPHQLTNLAAEPEFAERLDALRAALDQWAEETGDTLPRLEDMAPERNDRETWQAIPGLSGRPPGAKDVPGHATRAWTINQPGPIRMENVGGSRP